MCTWNMNQQEKHSITPFEALAPQKPRGKRYVESPSTVRFLELLATQAKKQNAIRIDVEFSLENGIQISFTQESGEDRFLPQASSFSLQCSEAQWKQITRALRKRVLRLHQYDPKRQKIVDTV